MSLGLRLPTWRGWGLLLPVAPLCAASVMTIHVTSGAEPGRLLANAALMQSAYMLLGLGGMLLALAVGYHRIGRWSYLLFGACLLLLLYLVLDRWLPMPLVDPRRNSRRWIGFARYQIQPSELMKIAYVLALAWYLRYRRNYRTVAGLVMPFGLTLVPMALIQMQPDLGTVLLFLPVLFAMLFAAGAKVRHLSVVVLLALVCLPFFWFEIKTYQRLRITGVILQSPEVRKAFLEKPERWDALRPRDEAEGDWKRELREWEKRTGYQLVHSKTAIGSGGVGGEGYGAGIFSEHNLLPERHNDFIFAMIAHQWGFLGSLALLACYGVMVVIGMDVATTTKDPFGRLVAVGFATLIAVQALTNLCMTVGLGPITGVTLPFVSAGGSSLIASFLCIGLLISVAQHRPLSMGRLPFEFDEEAERYNRLG
ncbi:MAG: hypothetical protein AMXMBFR13_36980 [Phycisphaerae bacterium]